MGENNGVAYYVRAHLEAFGRNRAQAKMRRFANTFSRAGASIEAAGRKIQGGLLGALSTTAKIGGAIGVLAGGYGFGKLITSSVAFNEQLETVQGTMASTFQLYSFYDNFKFDPGMDHATREAQRFKMNLELAHGEMDRIFDIAAKSPATFEQGMKLYQNMLPGAAGITRDLDRIRNLYRRALPLGLITGGDYAVAGQQLGRILTGGAGAEYDTWKKLQQPILRAGKGLGMFKNIHGIGDDLTKAFNQLAGEDRLKLLEEATKSLDATTEFWGQTWVGVKSTLISIGQLMQRAFGRAIFEGIKERGQRLVKLLDPEKNTFKRLEKMMETWGHFVAGPINAAFDWVFVNLDYLSKNWEEVSAKFLRGASIAKTAAILLAKAAVVRTGVGLGMRAGGMVMQGGAKAMEMGQAVAAMGAAGLPAIGLITALAVAIGGLSIAAGGVLAVFVKDWNELVDAFIKGDIHIEPLLQVLADLWEKFVAVGEVFLGTSDTVGAANSIILSVANAMLLMMDIMGGVLRVTGYLSIALQGIVVTIKNVIGALGIGLAQAIKSVLQPLADLPGVGKALDPVMGAMDGMIGASQQWIGGFGDIDSKFLDAADAWDEARGKIDVDDLAARLRASAEEAKKARDNAPDPSGDITDKPPGNTTHIYKMNVIQDLRNHDPDRIIGAFKKAVNDSVKRRVSANTGIAGAQ